MNKRNLLKTTMILVSSLLTALTIFTGCKSTGKKQLELTDLKSGTGENVKVYIIDSGYVTVKDFSIFGGKAGEAGDVPVTSYLIVHPKGTLLWDTGLADEIAQMENGKDIFGGHVVWHLEKTLISQLDEIGISISDIDYLGLSHLHGDHIGNLALFKDTTILIDTNEFDSIPATAEYAKQSGLSTANLDLLAGHKKVVKTSGFYDVFGDGSVVMVPIPGHSPGHTALFTDLKKTGPVVLTGDMYLSEEDRKNYTVSPLTLDKKQLVKSFVVIDDLIDQTGAALWHNHDIEQVKQLQHAPFCYE